MTTPTKIYLRDLIEDWLKSQNAHHHLDTVVPVWITCDCHTSLFNFLVLNNLVYISRRKSCSEVTVTLNPANPRFFDKLQYFLEQACDKRSL